MLITLLLCFLIILTERTFMVYGKRQSEEVGQQVRKLKQNINSAGGNIGSSARSAGIRPENIFIFLESL